MGRVKDNHPSHKAKSGAETNDDPNIPDKVIPGFQQKEHQVSHLNSRKDPSFVATKEVENFARKAGKHEEVTSANELANSVRQRVVQKVVSGEDMRVGEGYCGDDG